MEIQVEPEIIQKIMRCQQKIWGGRNEHYHWRRKEVHQRQRRNITI